MPRAEDLLFSPTKWTVVASGTNAIVTATRSAPAANMRNYIVGISISASGTPATAITAQVRKASGGTILDQFQIPAVAFAPIVINYVRPIDCGNADCGITGTVVLRGFQSSP